MEAFSQSDFSPESQRPSVFTILVFQGSNPNFKSKAPVTLSPSRIIRRIALWAKLSPQFTFSLFVILLTLLLNVDTVFSTKPLRTVLQHYTAQQRGIQQRNSNSLKILDVWGNWAVFSELGTIFKTFNRNVTAISVYIIPSTISQATNKTWK
jgi:hypothetical protein